MGTWNHRLFKETTEDGDFYSIKEVFYDDNNIPKSRTVEGASACGDTVEEVRRDLERMLKSLDSPVLTESDFVGNREHI